MEKQVLKKLYLLKLILFWNLFLAIILILTACSDLVKESDIVTCNNAMDSRDYDTAITVCTSRKDKASAYMGKAGYDIVNLLKESGSSVSTLEDNTTGNDLGTDSVLGASILNLLKLSVDEWPNYIKRSKAITNSKNYLDKASALLHPYLNDNSSPLSTDEIFLDSFALAFAMQLDQMIIYDNATTSTSSSPDNSSGSLICHGVTGADEAVLVAMDGHLWDSERKGMQCTRLKNAINLKQAEEQTLILDDLIIWERDGGPLPEDIKPAVCDPIDSLNNYYKYLSANIVELKKTGLLSGNNTKTITDAQTSTIALLKTVGCED